MKGMFRIDTLLKMTVVSWERGQEALPPIT
jgi:hypothetical protein